MPSLPSVLSCLCWDGSVLGSVNCCSGEKKSLLKTLSQDVNLSRRKSQFHQGRLGLGKSKSKQTMVWSVPSCHLSQQMHLSWLCKVSLRSSSHTWRWKQKRTIKEITRRGNHVLAALWSDHGFTGHYVLQSSFGNMILLIDFPKCRL